MRKAPRSSDQGAFRVAAHGLLPAAGAPVVRRRLRQLIRSRINAMP
jgi:hypothetical protein